MNIKQLTEAVAMGASPLAVINAAIREGIGTSYLKQPIRTAKDIGAQPQLGNKVTQLTHIQPHHMIDDSHSGKGWAVHLDRSVVAPGTSYTSAPSHSPQFKEYMRAAGIPHLTDHSTSHGYDDVTFEFKDRDHAHQVSKALNQVLPGPSKEYRDNYMPDVNSHHAHVVRYDYENGYPEGPDTPEVEESLAEGNPSGISRAWDQPGRMGKKRDAWQSNLDYYQASAADDNWSARQAANLRAQGPELDWSTRSDRKEFLGKYKQGQKDFSSDSRVGKSYSELPPMLQRLVKKNVRAKAAEPGRSKWSRGPLAGKSGYQAYDTKHQAAAAVGFDPADAFKSHVGAGYKVDPAVNARQKDHESFKDALSQLGRSGRNGAQHGKQVKVAGQYSWDRKYSHITHVHHPDHGEIQLFSPDDPKDEPTIYHRPVGAGRGKMHKWSSPEAQKIVQAVHSSGEGWPR